MEDKDLKRLRRTMKTDISPCHCILDSERQPKEAGFKGLGLGDTWKIVVGGNYYVKVFGSSLMASTMGGNLAEVPSLRMAASRTDWSCLKLKPSPEVNTSQYGKLDIEVYGGAIHNTWLDRPLSMASKVCMAGENPFGPVTRYVGMEQPLVIVPNLAIHVNREVSKDVELDVQVNMLPVLTMFMEDLGKDNYSLNLLTKEVECLPKEILDYDIYLYNLGDCTTLGLHGDFSSAPRLDNITSVQACLTGILEGKRDSGIDMITLHDSEGVESHTKQGTLSSVTERVLEKLYLSLGYTGEGFLNGLLDGFLLSVDVAHVLHPNRVEKCDIKNQVLSGDGVAIRMAAGQSYATDAAAISVIEGVCRTYEIPCKKFSNRSDMRGGSTLGALSSSLLSMGAVDMGVSMLTMHSARELMGNEDQATLVTPCTNFFRVS